MSTVEVGWPLAGLLAGLALAAAAVVAISRLGRPMPVLTAAGRAVAQLAVVSVVIGVALGSMLWTSAFLAVMVLVAAGTSAHRITGRVRPSSWWLVVPILSGVAPTLVLVLGSTVVPLEPVALLPTAGILIGGAMTATTLAGRRSCEELVTSHGTYEAALSLGLTRRDAVLLVVRPAAALALVPGLDQTRTVGLVTLPGAFVGVLLAGAPATQAGAAQALVLIALLAVQALAATVTVELVAAGRVPVAGTTLAP